MGYQWSEDKTNDDGCSLLWMFQNWWSSSVNITGLKRLHRFKQFKKEVKIFTSPSHHLCWRSAKLPRDTNNQQCSQASETQHLPHLPTNGLVISARATRLQETAVLISILSLALWQAVSLWVAVYFRRQGGGGKGNLQPPTMFPDHSGVQHTIVRWHHGIVNQGYGFIMSIQISSSGLTISHQAHWYWVVLYTSETVFCRLLWQQGLGDAFVTGLKPLFCIWKLSSSVQPFVYVSLDSASWLLRRCVYYSLLFWCSSQGWFTIKVFQGCSQILSIIT